MNILFVSSGDHTDINLWSGTVYHLSNTIEKLGYNVDYIDNLGKNKLLRLIAKSKEIFTGNKYQVDRNRIILKKQAREISKKIESQKYDLIFAPSTLPFTYLNVDIPKVAFTDATFKSMLNYYEEFNNFSESAIKEGNIHEKMALENCDYIIYSSDWAKQSAMRNYNIDENKLGIVNFGANMESKYDINEIKSIIKNKLESYELKLLFIGVDWYRKGGDTVLNTLRVIKNRGIDVKLNVVGCEPTIPDDLQSNVKVHGFLDKSKENDYEEIIKLLKESHFLFVPTKMEAFGIVYAEASSFGLPSIATKTGGVTSAIKQGYNGFCLDLESNEEDYSKIIINTWNNKDLYSQICHRSYYEYAKRLNWEIAGLEMQKIFKSLVK